MDREPSVELEPDILADPLELVGDWIDSNPGKKIILFGEDGHYTEGVLAFEPKLVDYLADNYHLVKVFLEEDIKYNPLLQQYYQDGVIPAELEEYLTQGGARADSKETHSFKLEILKKCYAAGVRVHFIAAETETDDVSEADIQYTGEIVKNMPTEDKPDDVCLVVVGASHASHKPILVPAGRRMTVGNLLDNQHFKVLSILAGGIYEDPLVHKTRGDTVLSDFISNLSKLGKANQPVAVTLSGSPYRNWNLNTNNNLTGEDYDILMAVPSKNWFRAIEGQPLIDFLRAGGRILKATTRIEISSDRPSGVKDKIAH